MIEQIAEVVVVTAATEGLGDAAEGLAIEERVAAAIESIPEYKTSSRLQALVASLRDAISGGGDAEQRGTRLRAAYARNRRGMVGIPGGGSEKAKLARALEKARKAAAEGREILPGIFRYQETPTIPGYQQHHLWPPSDGRSLRDGMTVYARNVHATVEGIQGRLNSFLRGRLNLQQRELEQWSAGDNPKKLLPLLREFYKGEGIPFPY